MDQYDTCFLIEASPLKIFEIEKSVAIIRIITAYTDMIQLLL